MMEQTRHTIKIERVDVAPQQRHHAGEAPALVCRLFGHLRVPWPAVPALSMCARCYTSWVEVRP